MNYRVRIKNPNKMFIIKNKPVRSPFESIVNEIDLKIIKSRIKFYGLINKDYEIEQIDIIEDQKKDYSYIPSERQVDKKIRQDIKTSNNQNTLNSENKNIAEQKSKQKVIKKEEKVVHQKQELSPHLPIIPQTKLQDKPEIKKSIDPEKIIEQINDNGYNTSDVEVRIEELTVKSASILEKFLNSEF